MDDAQLAACMALHAGYKYRPRKHKNIVRHLLSLDPDRRYKIALLPPDVLFAPDRKYCHVVSGHHFDGKPYGFKSESLQHAVDSVFNDEVKYLIEHGAVPRHSPLCDAFRDHPEILPTMLGIDPKLDELIATRLKT